MKETTERTALGEAILKHWREHCPQMVRDLEKENRLEQAVFETQTRTGDLLYELVSVKKMDYHAAWELAREEWALPQGENKGENKSEKEGENKTENNSGDRSGNTHPAESPPPETSPQVTSPYGTSRSTTSPRSRKRGRRRGTSG